MAQNKIVIAPDTTTVTVSSVGLNGPAGADGSVTFPYTGSAIISGSLDITGSLNVTGTTSGSFIGDGSGLVGVPLGDVFPYTGSALITGSLDITGSITGPDYIDFAIGVDVPYAEGRLFYDQPNGALGFYNNEADITLQIGQEFYKKVTNRSGETITNGTPVFISGSQGDLSKIFPAISKNIYDNSFDPSSNSIIGLATHDIEDNSSGFVTEKGVVRGVDTRDYEAGDKLYLQTGSVGFRNTPPPFPFSVVEVGTVGRSTVNGFIEVEPVSSIVSENISGIINIALEVQSNESITIPKGTPVHINNTVSGTGPVSLVNIAKANSASLMPATYVTEEEITSGSIGTALSIGYIPRIDTSGLNVGDTLYVGGEGGFTTAKPTGSSFIQNLGVVVQSDATDGSAFIYGSGRSNDLPNIQEGYAWVGNSDGVATAVTTGSLLPYTSLVQLLNQTSTNAPVATEVYNNTGETFTWSYVSQGVYRITGTNTPFTLNKTVVFGNLGSYNTDNLRDIGWNRISDSIIEIETTSNNDTLTNGSFEVKIYN